VTTTTVTRRARGPQDEAVRLARRAAAALEPTESLRAIADLRRRLDALEAQRIDAALRDGCSWRVIADALGVSRQAAHRKHAARVSAASKHASVAGNRLVIVGPARVAVVFARQEAAIAQSSRVGTEHLLIGLVRERDGIAAEALATLGVTLDKVRHCAQARAHRARGEPETEDLSPPGWAPASRLPFSRRGREALEQSLREAVRLGDGKLGVEHLLLALLRDGDARAVQCLERLRVTAQMVEDEIGRLRLATANRGD
jgi:hypothetical protein